jgi:hypothetical protein
MLRYFEGEISINWKYMLECEEGTMDNRRRIIVLRFSVYEYTSVMSSAQSIGTEV